MKLNRQILAMLWTVALFLLLVGSLEKVFLYLRADPFAVLICGWILLIFLIAIYGRWLREIIYEHIKDL